MKVVEFCSSCSKCPVVKIDEQSVEIGEGNNVVRLTLDQFADLKKAIIDGKL